MGIKGGPKLDDQKTLDPHRGLGFILTEPAAFLLLIVALLAWPRRQRTIDLVREVADKLARMIGKKEPQKRRELVAQQLRVLADDLEELWKAATRDPAAERRKQRGWILLTGALGAASTMASRKVMTKLWPILTGEPVPSVAPPSSPPTAREPEPEAEPQQVPR